MAADEEKELDDASQAETLNDFEVSNFDDDQVDDDDGVRRQSSVDAAEIEDVDIAADVENVQEEAEPEVQQNHAADDVIDDDEEAEESVASEAIKEVTAVPTDDHFEDLIRDELEKELVREQEVQKPPEEVPKQQKLFSDEPKVKQIWTLKKALFRFRVCRIY